MRGVAEAKLAILYAAKSSPDEKGSIADQLKEARAWAQEQGLEVIAEYSEEDVTAYKGDRGPELAKALAHAEEAGAVLVAQHSDRLARGDGKQARHLVEIALWALKADVAIHCCQDPSTFENLVMAAVMGERNMEDSKRKSKAVRAGLARRRGRGLHPGGSPPFGYRYRRNEADQRVFAIDQERAPWARLIFDRYLAGSGYVSIARELEAEGVASPSGNRTWNHCSVRQILMNPAYAGLIRHDKELIAAAHEPIIDRETWGKAQALQKAKARTHKRGRPSAGKHLFRGGFLKCGICGGSIGPITYRRRYGKAYERYYCHTRRNRPGACTMPSLNRDRVDEAVYAYFGTLGLDMEATREQLALASEQELAKARNILKSAEEETQVARERLGRIKRDYVCGELSATEWRELKAELEPELCAAQAETERLRERLQEAEGEEALSQVTSELLGQLSEIRAEITGEVTDSKGAAAVRAALMRLFEGFVLHRGSPRHEGREQTKVAFWLEPVLSQDQMERLRTELRPPGGRNSFGEAENNSDRPGTRSKSTTALPAHRQGTSADKHAPTWLRTSNSGH